MQLFEKLWKLLLLLQSGSRLGSGLGLGLERVFDKGALWDSKQGVMDPGPGVRVRVRIQFRVRVRVLHLRAGFRLGLGLGLRLGLWLGSCN